MFFSLFSYPLKHQTRSLTPLNMPDYAEVAGCSTFKNNTTSPLYDSYGAYATTNLVRNANVFAGAAVYTNNKNSEHYHHHHNFAHSDFNFLTTATVMPMSTNNNNNKIAKLNIIENKMDIINNLNRSAIGSSTSSCTSSSTTALLLSAAATSSSSSSSSQSMTSNSVPATPIIGTMRRSSNRLPKVGHCDKISFGGCDRPMEQPLFVKSKEDGTWASVQNSSYHYPVTATKTSNNISDSLYKINGSNVHKNINTNIGSGNLTGSQVYLTSFGKYDNV